MSFSVCTSTLLLSLFRCLQQYSYFTNEMLKGKEQRDADFPLISEGPGKSSHRVESKDQVIFISQSLALNRFCGCASELSFLIKQQVVGQPL